MAITFHVTSAGLNLRAQPDPASAIVAVLMHGDALRAAGDPPVVLPGGNIWVNVRNGAGATGFVNHKFTDIPVFHVDAQGLNLRTDHDPMASVVAVLTKDDILVAAGEDLATLPGGSVWINVHNTGGATGWVNKQFVAAGLPTGGGSRVVANGQLAWGAKVSTAFRDRVRQIATNLDCNPDHLMAAMAFETGKTFSPSIQNASSMATGLIQFLPSTAIGLGTTINELKAMTAVRQLDIVERYLTPFKDRLETIEDLYMSILFPVAVGKANSFVLFSEGSLAYTQNRGLDGNDDGHVTKAEAASPVVARLQEGRQADNLA